MQNFTSNTSKLNILTTCSLLVVAFLLLAAKPISRTIATSVGDYNLVSKVPVNGNALITDFLKSAYVITNKNQVLKYDSTGTKIGNYSENRYGQLTSIDATSPFNVLLFYKDMSTIVSADMKLTPKRLYRLANVGINNVAAVCLAHDNYIWIYDMDAGKLKKINPNYEVIAESVDVPQLLGSKIEPNYVVEKDGLVYLNVPGFGIVIFDVFGTYYTAVSNLDISKDDLQNFQVVQHKIVFYEKGKLNIYNLSTREVFNIPVPKTDGVKEVRVEKGRLFMLNDKELQLYVQVQ